MPYPKPPPRHPVEIQLSERDTHLLEFMAINDGIVSQRQLHRVFFPDRVLDTVEKSMDRLYAAHFVGKPRGGQYKSAPEFYYYLKKRGWILVAGLQGDAPNNRDAVLKKVETGNTFILAHHFQMVDLRIKTHEACLQDSRLHIGESISERDYRRLKHKIYYVDKSGRRKGVIFEPDWYCAIQETKDKAASRREIFPLLWEVDRSTHSRSVIEDRKIRAGIAYLLSDIYEQQITKHGGKLLFVAKTWERIYGAMPHVRRLEAQIPGACEVVCFTTFADAMAATNILTSPVWAKATPEGDKQASLIPFERD